MASLNPLQFRIAVIGADGRTDIEREALKLHDALATLVDFIDGVSYAELPPGLFAKVRTARMLLCDDPIAVELRAQAART